MLHKDIATRNNKWFFFKRVHLTFIHKDLLKYVMIKANHKKASLGFVSFSTHICYKVIRGHNDWKEKWNVPRGCISLPT
jgi:hypothetical protein